MYPHTPERMASPSLPKNMLQACSAVSPRSISITPDRPYISITPGRRCISITPDRPCISITPGRPCISITPGRPIFSPPALHLHHTKLVHPLTSCSACTPITGHYADHLSARHHLHRFHAPPFSHHHSSREQHCSAAGPRLYLVPRHVKISTGPDLGDVKRAL